MTKACSLRQFAGTLLAAACVAAGAVTAADAPAKKLPVVLWEGPLEDRKALDAVPAGTALTSFFEGAHALRTQAEWEKAWKAVGRKEAPPKIDFERYTLVVISGWAREVVIKREKEGWQVSYSLSKPRPKVDPQYVFALFPKADVELTVKKAPKE